VTEDRSIRFALGVSSPFGWKHLESFGASAYVGLGEHHALRATFTRDHPEDLLTLIATGFEGTPYAGRVLDAGLGWVWYPDRLWDGLMLEAGALRRQREVVSAGEFAPVITTQTVTYAGRGMIGWSWRVAGPLFIAVAAGISMGFESGVETIEPDFPFAMATTNRVARLQVDGEAYLRIGLAFGR
jgi:hypothetical protein